MTSDNPIYPLLWQVVVYVSISTSMFQQIHNGGNVMLYYVFNILTINTFSALEEEMYNTVILLLPFIWTISCLSTELCDHNKFSSALVSTKTCVLDNFKKLLQENSIQPSNLIGI